MAASPARSRQPGVASPLSIGQVLAKLTPDFPDLTSSKVRFLEEKGLVTPARTASGYRKFDRNDVERLRLVLALQRDHYLPLRVIHGYLVELDAGNSPAFPGGENSQGPSMLSGARRYTRDELLREASASPQLLDDAVSASLVTAAEHYGDDVVAILRALAELRKSGIEPRHLRGVRAAAERELGLIESALVPIARRKDITSRAKATELALEIVGQLEVVRGSIIRSALARIKL